MPVWILEKNFFFLHQIFPVQVDPDKDEEVHMFFARGERWRRLRSIANPAFNTGKMRLVSQNNLLQFGFQHGNRFCTFLRDN